MFIPSSDLNEFWIGQKFWALLFHLSTTFMGLKPTYPEVKPIFRCIKKGHVFCWEIHTHTHTHTHPHTHTQQKYLDWIFFNEFAISGTKCYSEFDVLK